MISSKAQIARSNRAGQATKNHNSSLVGPFSFVA